MAILLIVLISAMFGVTQIVKADVDIPVTKLYQNDYAQKMDNSTQTIADYGCGLTSDTMLYNQALGAQGLHVKNPDGSQGAIISYTPAELNTLLNNYRYVETGGVDKGKTKNGWGVTIGADGNPIGSSTDINEGALRKAVESDTKSRSFEGQGLVVKAWPTSERDKDIPAGGVTLDENYMKVLDELKAGRPVVVRTYDDRHWVLVKSFTQVAGQPEGRGRYDIADPWKKEDGSSIEWLDDPDYQNKIWERSTGVFQKGGSHDPYQVPSDYWIDPEYLYDPEMNPDQYGPQLFEPSFPFPPPEGGVGGVSFPINVVPVDKFGLLAPYIGLASTILVATAATAIYVKRVKRRKEKQ